MRPPAVLAIHGGAGPAPASAEGEGPDRRHPGETGPAAIGWSHRAAGLAIALRAGLRVLADGGPALEAVTAAVTVLEDDEQWNAGRGSVLTAAGTVEMDAAVADGRDRRLAGVACLTGIRNPVLAARALLDDGRHVLLAGPAATDFGRQAGLAFEPEEWFVTERRRLELSRRTPAASGRSGVGGTGGSTVGAVARDVEGHLAAATSTGGRTGQLPGRIGDSPVPGAGTWADDSTCAVSATGVGEAFLRAAFAHEVDARLRLGGVNLETACREALAAVTAAGGDGGCIAVSAQGPPVLPFTTALMHRAWAEVGGPLFGGAGPGRLERIE